MTHVTIEFFFILFFSFTWPPAMDQNSSHRRILIFAPDSTNSAYQQQNQLLQAQTAGCIERDMLVENYPDTPENAAVFNAFQVDPTHFALLLIGKDGSVKLRSKDVLSADHIFGIIDAMPMRKDEIKRKKKG